MKIENFDQIDDVDVLVAIWPKVCESLKQAKNLVTFVDCLNLGTGLKLDLAKLNNSNINNKLHECLCDIEDLT